MLWKRVGVTARFDRTHTASEVFATWLAALHDAIESGDQVALGGLFVEDCYWKDVLAFTWSYRTFHGRAELQRRWAELQGDVLPSSVRPSQGRSEPRLTRRSARDVVEAFFDFDIKIGRCTAFVRLVSEDGDWDRPRGWIMLTTLQELYGAEERIGPRRPTGEEYSNRFAGDNWLDERRREAEFIDRQPEVLIVGGGHSGLVLAARLRHMGVDCLVIERNHRVGDNWRHRYHSLTLHNEVWANHMPYLPFPETWPTFMPKDKLAGWLESYVEFMELNVWTDTEMTGARYDSQSRTWQVEIVREGTMSHLAAPHLVLATGGVSGVPNIPALAGLRDFSGDVVHSSEFRSGEAYRGRTAIVVGTGNSAHDVAQELHANGATVTMVQRSPTCVVSLVPSGTMVYALYSEGRSADDSDLIMTSAPYPLFVESSQWVTKRTCELDKPLLDQLNAVGFETDFEPDATGFYMKYLRRGGGYYINVGCSDLIADGKIGLVQARDMKAFTADGLRMRDGRLIAADLVVLATGFENQQEGIRRLLGDEIANKVGPIWGFDENHIMRNMWQRTAQEGLWLMGGSLIDSRLYSRYLALQITADLRQARPTPSKSRDLATANAAPGQQGDPSQPTS